jgi:hypothetical protein
MKNLLLSLAFLAAVTCQAEPPIVTTLIVKPVKLTNDMGVWTGTVAATNSIVIPNGQAARVASIWIENDVFVSVEKDGVVLQVSKGDVLQGPAIFSVWTRGDLFAEPSVLTLERWAVKKAR